MENVNYKDPLTGLYDHDFFQQQLSPLLKQMADNQRWGALVLVELKNLDELSRTSGQEVADRILARVAEMVRYSVRISDLVARYGDNRFAILLQEGMQPTAAINLVKRQFSRLAEPIRVRGQQVELEIAVGIRVVAPEGREAVELIAQAERALEEAKGVEGGGYHIFQEEDDHRFDIAPSHSGGHLAH
ncbi:diguanylate cyclase domain-containing protein [Motiliproteus sp. SC1-56]|uniref:diguanylate cyclase domain-containing protein n=1 Tax=Motiliproteus sp. SC1-56 TaxID=2799565 RepID=UPI001A8C7B24|nr:diguanylate cyclase [Motiliproteus sp. SC1-56]